MRFYLCLSFSHFFFYLCQAKGCLPQGFIIAQWTEKGLRLLLAWTTFARYQQEVLIPASTNQVIDCINYSWTRELDIKLWIQHSFTSFRISLLWPHFSPPLLQPHFPLCSFECLSAPQKVATLKPQLPCFVIVQLYVQLQLASVRPNSQHRVMAASVWFSPYLSLGNRWGSHRIPS